MPNNGPTYDHTAAGRLATRTWKRGITTAYYYDLAGDLRAVDYSDTATPDVFHTRDRLGRATHSAQGTLAVAADTLPVATGGITVTAIRSATYGYDPSTLAPATEAVDYGGGFTQTLTRTYEDGANGTISGRPNGHTFAGGSATWTYDNTGRPSTLTDGTDTFTYGYAPGSDLVRTVTKAAGGAGIPALVATRTWDSTRDVLQKIENAAGPTIRSAYDYSTVNGGVNSIGQRKGVQATFDLGTGVTGNTGSISWNYDDLGHLTSAATPVTDNNRAYQYDGIGNRIEAREGVTAVTGTANYAANALNQYTAVPYSPPAPAYDGDGNMETGPLKGGSGIASGALVWDAENRLIRADVGGVTVTYAYDHLSRLISRSVGIPTTSTTRYLYDGWNRIAEYSGQDLQKTYLWGLDISGTPQGAGGVGGLLSVSQEGSVFYPTYDGNGNVSEYITSAGAVAAHFEYDPFGNTVVSTDATNQFEYRFSTKPIDPTTGLLYYGYRWYDPLTGRWPSRDPITERGGVNLYGFVGNDGVKWFDILGLFKKPTKDGAVEELKKALPLMQEECRCCVAPDNVEKCKNEAAEIIDALVAVWEKNYKDVQTDDAQVGGHFCWSWANGFGTNLAELARKKNPNDSERPPDRKLEIWKWHFRTFFRKPGPDDDTDPNSKTSTHFAVSIQIANPKPQVKDAQCNGFSVDDGYFEDGVFHEDNKGWPNKKIVGNGHDTPWIESDEEIRPGFRKDCDIGGKP